jgi:chaperone modulatory protein CbpM
MLDLPKLARELRVDSERLQIFIDRGWIAPPILEGRPVFRDVDVARAALIADLADAMGVNDEGVDLVLDLLDQLYSLRFALSDRCAAGSAAWRPTPPHE